MLRCIMDAEMNAVLQTSAPPAPIRRERIGTWRERLWLPNGREVLMRPIEAIDAEPLRRSFARLSPEEVRLRFLHPITEMTAGFARQLCELDRQTGFALVVTEPLPAGEALIGAVARLAIEPEHRDAEFAIIVGREIGGLGLGIFLMKRLIDYARRRRLDVCGATCARKTRRCSRSATNSVSSAATIRTSSASSASASDCAQPEPSSRCVFFGSFARTSS